MDSNLLKEAIADAKAVRQTALANAKVALEEAFNEKYQAMFAEKLREDAGMGQPPQASPGQGTMPEENVSESEIDELIKELENEVNPNAENPEGEEHPEPDADNMPGAVPPPAAPMGGAVPPPPAPPMGGAAPQMVMCPVGQVATADMAPAAGAMPTAPGVPPMAGSPAPIGGEIPPMAGAPTPMGGAEQPPTPPSDVPPAGEEETDEEISLDELLESLKEEVESEDEEECKIKENFGEKEEEKEECDETIDEQKKLASSAIGGKVGGSDNKKPSASASSTSAIETGGIKQEGMPSPDGTKVGPEDATKATRPNKSANATPTKLTTPSLGGQSGAALKASRPNCKGDFENTSKLEENTNLKKQLNEAEQVIKFVKTQLNEVNLLNAKLLYTNKLFKEYNMNNTHKMRIVEMFDLAKNVREVKLTYANIAESLNFSGNEIKKKVVATTNSSVQSITEGLASKPMGSTKPGKQIINENSEMYNKFQKLAGITKH